MMKLIMFSMLWVVSATSLVRAGGVPIFSENFDDAPPYKPKGEVPVGHDIISHGEWGKAGSGNRPGYVNSEISLSAPYSLGIQATQSFEKGTRALCFSVVRIRRIR